MSDNGTKTKFADGPWTNEPDHEEFESSGFACAVHRHSKMGFLCGYVTVPKGHPLHGLSYESPKLAEVEVHGGLTWGGEIGCVEADGWSFGFHCAHLFDIIPGSADRREPGSAYRDFAFVRSEVAHLASQLSKIQESPDATH